MKYWVATYSRVFGRDVAVVTAEDEEGAREELHRYLSTYVTGWHTNGDPNTIEIRELESPVDEVWDGDY